MKRISSIPYQLPTSSLPTPYQVRSSLVLIERTTHGDVAALAGSREWENILHSYVRIQTRRIAHSSCCFSLKASTYNESSIGRLHVNVLKILLMCCLFSYCIVQFSLGKKGFESVTNCNQLKLRSSDGESYKTDVVDAEQLFRIIQSILSPKAEPINNGWHM